MSLIIPKVKPAAGNVSSALVPQERQGPVIPPSELGKKGKKKPKERPSEYRGTRPLEYTAELRRARAQLLGSLYGIQAVPVLPRLPTDGHVTSYIHNVQRYLTSTGLERTFLGMVQTLLSLPELPYNPYPALVYSVQTYMESLRIKEEKLDEIQYCFNHPIRHTRIDYLYKAVNVDFVWGLPAILQCVNAERMAQYRWLMTDMVPPIETLASDNPLLTDYTIQPMVALVGPAIFHDTFYNDVHAVEVRVEYLIVGPALEPSFDLFLTCLVKDLNFTEKTTHHILLGVSVPVNPQVTSLKCTYRFWQVDEINTRAEDFWAAALAAIKQRKAIIAELIFKMDLFMLAHKRGRKFYSFNFVQRADTFEDKEKLYCFVEHAEGSLFDGVFFERSHAEAYLNMFTPRMELMDLDKIHKIPPPPPPPNHTAFNRVTFPDPSKPILKALRQPKKLPILAPLDTERPDDDDLEEMLAVGRGGDLRNPKVKIDGFTLTRSKEYSPESWKIVAPIMSSWQRFIARSHPIGDLFDLMPYLTQIILMNRPSYPPNLLVQCYRVLRSKAYTMFLLVNQNRFIRELIENFEKAEESQTVQLQFKLYRKNMRDLLNSKILHCSSEMQTVGRVIHYRLETLTQKEGIQASNLIISPKCVLEMRFINFLCLPVMWQLTEDVMTTCPGITTTIQDIKKSFPEEIKKIEEVVPREEYFFGYEDERVYNQDRLFLEVSETEKRDIVLRQISSETVLMKYLLDTHIDEVWCNYLKDIFVRLHLPADPYPLLITELRRACLKMNMYFESDAEVMSRVYHAKPRLVDPTTFVYHVPGCDAYGFQSALRAVDTAAIFRITPLLQSLQTTLSSTTLNRQGYKAAIAMTVTGNMPYFGRLDPYLRTISLSDHIYIKGPTSCSKEGSELFAIIISQHILELHRRPQSNFVIVGVFLNERSQRWGIEEIQKKTRSFEVDIEDCVAERKSIYLKMFAIFEWRYVEVKKYFRYHYVSYDDTEYVRWFHESPVEPYLSIFLEKDQASFHAQLGGSHRCCDPFTGASLSLALDYLDVEAREAAQSQNWLDVHRSLLHKAFIKRSSGHVAEAYRMLQSIAARLSFVNHLNKTLQDLVFYVLEFREFRSPAEPVPLATLANAPQIDAKGNNFMPESILSDPVDEQFANLSLEVMQMTFTGYYHKLNDLVLESVSMSSDSMAGIMRFQINELIQRRSDGSISLIIDSSTIRRLEDIRQETYSLEVALAYDLHVSCPEAVQALATIKASKQPPRPSQIDQDPILERWEAFPPPLMLQADHMDEWHQWLVSPHPDV